MSIKRYEVWSGDSDGNDYAVYSAEHPAGDWVLHTDHLFDRADFARRVAERAIKIAVEGVRPRLHTTTIKTCTEQALRELGGEG